MSANGIDTLDGEALASAVAVRVMGWHWSTVFEDWQDKDGRLPSLCLNPWEPHLNIAQAFEVMHTKPGWRWNIREMEDGTIKAQLLCIGIQVDVANQGNWIRATCIAICRTALKAVKA